MNKLVNFDNVVIFSHAQEDTVGTDDELQKYLDENGVQTVIHYPIPPHKQECYKEWNYMSLPITEQIHNEELSLPNSPVLRDDEVKQVVKLINKIEL